MGFIIIVLAEVLLRATLILMGSFLHPLVVFVEVRLGVEARLDRGRLLSTDSWSHFSSGEKTWSSLLALVFYAENVN